MTLHILTAKPWLVANDTLQTYLAIAARETSDPLAAVARQAERRDALSVQDGTPRQDSTYTTMRDGVAVIEVVGPIFRYANMFTSYSGGTTTAQLAQDIQTALDAPDVRAILFAFDSPGGEATGIHELAQMIRAGRGTKPLIAYVGGMAASAAYWLASACDEIIVDATAELGSIGAVLALPNPQARSSREIEIVSAQSPNKRPDPLTESGRAQYQARVDALAGVFVADVARNRGVPEATVLAEFGQGGVFAGQQAIDAGLADRLGSFEGTLAQLAARVQPSPLRRVALAAEEQTMKLGAFFRSAFRAAEEAGIPLEPDEIAATEDASASDAAIAGLVGGGVGIAEALAEVESLRAQLAANRQAEADAASAQIGADATAFAQRLVAEERFLPAQASALEIVYRACQQAGCMDALTAIATQQPPVVRTGEVIAVADGAQVVQLGDDADPYAADKARARAYAKSKRGA